MKVVLTSGARADLDAILAFVTSNDPEVVGAFEGRLRLALRRIGRWPESGARVEGHADVHLAALVRYPYRIFYRIGSKAVEVLNIHYTVREPLKGETELAGDEHRPTGTAPSSTLPMSSIQAGESSSASGAEGQFRLPEGLRLTDRKERFRPRFLSSPTGARDGKAAGGEAGRFANARCRRLAHSIPWQTSIAGTLSA
jgi:toxin ParE1/3/4